MELHGTQTTRFHLQVFLICECTLLWSLIYQTYLVVPSNPIQQMKTTVMPSMVLLLSPKIKVRRIAENSLDATMGMKLYKCSGAPKPIAIWSNGVQQMGEVWWAPRVTLDMTEDQELVSTKDARVAPQNHAISTEIQIWFLVEYINSVTGTRTFESPHKIQRSPL